jgi:NADPH-dependent F420 reductase
MIRLSLSDYNTIMRIGIVGTGNIGGTLGRRWAAAHDVVFGVRSPGDEAVRAVVDQAGHGARALGVAEAAAFAEVLVIATPFGAVLDVVRAAGDLAGKVVVDATNPVGPGLRHALPSGSASDAIAAAAPGARVVKAFNTAGFEVLGDPAFGGESASLFLCGDDAGAKRAVADLAVELGLDPVDCGPLAQARRLEELALLWISMAAQGQGRGHAFRLLRR